MSTFEYTRALGQRLTYRITVDSRGVFQVALGAKVLKRGCDALVARGLREPGPEVQASSGRFAKVAVDYLLGMKET